MIVEDQLDDLNAELQRIREGADPRPIAEGAVPTPGQIWHMFLTVDPERRMKRLTQMLGMVTEGSACIVMNHDGRIDELEGMLTRRLLNELAEP